MKRSPKLQLVCVHEDVSEVRALKGCESVSVHVSTNVYLACVHECLSEHVSSAQSSIFIARLVPHCKEET